MTRKDRCNLVRKLEEYSTADPEGYKRRLLCLALLGYAYIFAILAFLCALTGVFVFLVARSEFIVALIIFLVTFAILIIRALWIRITPPSGIEITRAQFPRLFSLIDTLTAMLKAPRYDHVVVTSDFTAYIAQVPKLGFLGFQRNYIVLGLPLMQSFSPGQFRAIIVHELGHLSGHLSRFATWIYRIRATWYQIMLSLAEDRHLGSFIFTPFFHWYAPYFDACSFVLARHHEYEADRASSEIASVSDTSEALLRTAVAGRFIKERYWPSVYRRVVDEPSPPADVLERVCTPFSNEISPDDVKKWLLQELSMTTWTDSTHPSTRDRLVALGFFTSDTDCNEFVQKYHFEPLSETAAEYYLGGHLNELLETMRSQWEELIEPVWEKRHASAIKETERLKELEEKSTSGPLSSQEAWDRAELTVSLHGDEEALPLFREILASNPDDAHANYALGRILLQRGDAEGVGYMEKAMGKGPEFVESGYCLLEEYMRQGCSEEDAGEILERAERNLDIMSLAMRERVAVSSSDELVSPEISPAVIEDLEEQLKGFHEVLEAFFVRKVITYFPDRPFYLLAVTPFRPWYKLEDSNADSVLQEKLQSTLIFHKDMEDTIVIILRRKKSGLKKKLERITPSVRIYRKR